MNLTDRLRSIRVLPLVTIPSTEAGVRIAAALLRGGARGVEVALRSAAALDGIAAIRGAYPDLIVGAGTALTPNHLDEAAKAGAHFVVSPGLTTAMVEHARVRNIDLLPGVATASEVMRGMELGLDCFKLFPARAVNAPDLLASFAAPFPDVRFCPTGGIDEESLPSYLALPNVCCVAGSWMLTPSPAATDAWNEIEARMSRATAIARRATP